MCYLCIPSRQKMLDNQKILLVEDSDADRFLMTKFLNQLGYSFDCFCNGEELVNRLDQYPSCLILLDIELPLLNGIETARKIRATYTNPAEKRFILLGITSHNDPKKIKEIMESGFDACISKPVSRSMMKKKLEQFISPNATSQNQPEFDFEGCSENFKIYSLQSFQQDEADFVKSIIDIFLTTTPRSIADLKKAVDEHNPELLRQTAHRMKPHFSLFGMHETAAELNDLEHKSSHMEENHEIDTLICSIETTAKIAIRQMADDFNFGQEKLSAERI